MQCDISNSQIGLFKPFAERLRQEGYTVHEEMNSKKAEEVLKQGTYLLRDRDGHPNQLVFSYLDSKFIHIPLNLTTTDGKIIQIIKDGRHINLADFLQSPKINQLKPLTAQIQHDARYEIHEEESIESRYEEEKKPSYEESKKILENEIAKKMETSLFERLTKELKTAGIFENYSFDLTAPDAKVIKKQLKGTRSYRIVTNPKQNKIIICYFKKEKFNQAEFKLVEDQKGKISILKEGLVKDFLIFIEEFLRKKELLISQETALIAPTKVETIHNDSEIRDSYEPITFDDLYKLYKNRKIDGKPFPIFKEFNGLKITPLILNQILEPNSFLLYPKTNLNFEETETRLTVVVKCDKDKKIERSAFELYKKGDLLFFKNNENAMESFEFNENFLKKHTPFQPEKISPKLDLHPCEVNIKYYLYQTKQTLPFYARINGSLLTADKALELVQEGEYLMIVRKESKYGFNMEFCVAICSHGKKRLETFDIYFREGKLIVYLEDLQPPVEVAQFSNWMKERGLTPFSSLGKEINPEYKNPQALMLE